MDIDTLAPNVFPLGFPFPFGVPGCVDFAARGSESIDGNGKDRMIAGQMVKLE